MTPQERSEFIADIAEALAVRQISAQLSEDEISYVRLAIQKESQSVKLRQAIIEKTLTGLIWAGVVGMGYVFLEFLRSHGFRG